MKSPVIDRCGIAALSDLRNEAWRKLLGELEAVQSDFLGAEQAFRSSDYPWPRDPLHTWSRVWEYPYVLHHLREVLGKEFPAGRGRRIADLGSGVTFFPFALAREGWQVTCLDIDPVCGRDLVRAREAVNHAPGKIDFRLIEDGRLPMETGSLDGLYCISVLEHIPDFDRTISEMARVVRPGGCVVLTLDLDLRGDSAIGPLNWARLRDLLAEEFTLVHPERTTHPQDVLHSLNGPYPMSRLPARQELAEKLRRKVAEVTRGASFPPLPPPRLAVEGYVLRRS